MICIQKVDVVQADSYGNQVVEQAIAELRAHLSGMSQFV